MHKIQVLYTQGWPAKDKALEAIQQVLAVKQINVPIETLLINNEEEARKNQFLGSPTIKINGVDLEPSARDLWQTGMGWRFYASENGSFSKIPPESLIKEQIEVLLTI